MGLIVVVVGGGVSDAAAVVGEGGTGVVRGGGGGGGAGGHWSEDAHGVEKGGGKWVEIELMGFRERNKARAVAMNGEPLLCFLIRIYMCRILSMV